MTAEFKVSGTPEGGWKGGGRSVNPIPTKGTDYAQQTTKYLPHQIYRQCDASVNPISTR